MADREDVYEGDGEGTVKFTEDLFEDMQSALSKLMKTYSVRKKLQH